VIVPPSTGIPANGTSGLFGPLAIQVKIEVADVTLRNISIDGGGPNTSCRPMPRGSAFCFKERSGAA